MAFLIIYLLGSLFFSSGSAFASEFPGYKELIDKKLEKISSFFISIQEKLKLSGPNWQPEDWLGEFDINKIGKILSSSFGAFLSFLSNLFIIFIFLIFILAGKGKTKIKIKRSFEEKRHKKIIAIIDNIEGQIQKYLAIKTVVSFFTGVFATIVLLFFGVDFAIVFGFFTFILNYIPNLGSIIATALPVSMAFIQFETLWPAIWIFIILGSIQMTLGNIVEPRVMGEGLGLSTLVVLFFLFFWYWLWGIPGMILAVPTAAIAKIICSNVPPLNFIGELMSKG
jgi:predicted PurR-regulated permease PerM